MDNPNQETLQNWHDDAKNWKWSMFYCNKKDKRIFLEKKNPDYGITLNFANPKAYLAILIMVLFFGLILYMINKKAS
jgi:uncharacterized membrane protein